MISITTLAVDTTFSAITTTTAAPDLSSSSSSSSRFDYGKRRKSSAHDRHVTL